MPLKKPLKIFIDGYLLNKEPQGTQTYIKELYKKVALANPNHNFYIGLFYDQILEGQFSEQNNISLIYYKRRSRLWRMLFEIPRIIAQNKMDFAHFQYVIPIFRNKDCKYIVTIHDILFNKYPSYFSKGYRFKRNLLFKYSAKKADFLLTVSNYSKSAIKKAFDLPDKEIFLTPNGVSHEFTLDYQKKEAIDYIKNKYQLNDFILYVSRIEPRKNQELLIRMFKNLKLYDQNLQLVFIGHQTLLNQAFNKALGKLDPKVKKKIHYFEKVDQTDLLYFYKAASYFVYPSKAEGFGIPPLEAAALEIPVLCSNQTAMADFSFFKPYFVDPSDEQGFENAFKNLLASKNKLALGHIKKKILETYTWQRSALVLTEIFNT